jgi:nicotinamide-nucleotide amidase
MRIEVLAIGDELLDGRVADTNTLRLAEALASIGLRVAQRSTVVDDIEVIATEARAIAERGAKLCVVSGGLGPTSDDVTAAAFARLAGVELHRDEEQVRVIEEKLSFRGRELTANQSKQADRPAGSELIRNDCGTAPGFAIDCFGCRFVAMPGVPREYDAMVELAVLAPLRVGRSALPKRSLRCFGIPEAEVDARLDPLREAWPDIRLGFRAHFPEIHVTLKGSEAELELAFPEAQRALGREVFTTEDESHAEAVLRELRSHSLTLAVAESCTGGLVGDLITNVSGASDVFWGGIMSYSNDAKTRLLGIPWKLIDERGAVSEQVVEAMVAGVLERSGAGAAVAISGIAGPTGGTPDKPVGTVCVCAGLASGPLKTRTLRFPFERRRNKVISAHSALELLRRLLQGDNS